MAKIIVFGSQKGGVGKSTLTALAATAFSQAPFNYKVAVIDSDPQKSLADARKYDSEDLQAEPPYPIFNFDTKQLSQELPQLDQAYDLIFIDVAGKLDVNLPTASQEITPILLNTDLLIIPFTAGNYGLDATLRYLNFVLDVVKIKQRLTRPLHVAGFINMYMGRLKEDKFLRSMIEDIASETGLRFLTNNLGFYASYRGANTVQSLYNSTSHQPDLLNFKKWLNELHKIIENA